MSIWSRIRRAFGPSDDFWYNPVGFPSSTGVRVNEQTALQYLTLYACVSLISGDLARLPLNLYRRRGDGGKDQVTDHDLYDLLHNAPNPETTSFNWREAAQGHLLLWGNTFSFIERQKGGKISGLWLKPDPGDMELVRVGGELKYKYTHDGREVIRSRDQIFHIPGYGFNGLWGRSMVAMAREAIGMGISMEQFGSKYFSEGTHPSGVLEMERVLGENRDEFLKAIQKGYAGLGKSHKIMVLENGMTYKPLTVPLEDAQFLESRQFQKTEICGMYHVPPHKIAIHGQNSNYNNLEQENASYVDSCLMHWIVRWESAISQQLLTPAERKAGLFFEFQVQGLLRGDSAARAEYYNKLFQVGAMSPNKILALENENPVEGGDQHFVMLNMIPLDKARQAPHLTLEDDSEPDPGEMKSYFGDLDVEYRKVREKRSIVARDRIASQFKPLIFEAARAIVNRETMAIKKFLNKRAMDDFEQFLDEFYAEFPEFIHQKMSPVLRSFMYAIIDQANLEFDLTEKEFDAEVNEYIDTFSARHIDSSHGQMLALIDQDPELLETRADEWADRRPDKITANELVRAASAAYAFAVFAGGLRLVWQIRGDYTCPYCKTLNGRKIRSDQHFVGSGDEIDLKDGSTPMKSYGIKRHPPLHQKCDCYVTGI
jgi:HK97 family phage portal protein